MLDLFRPAGSEGSNEARRGQTKHQLELRAVGAAAADTELGPPRPLYCPPVEKQKNKDNVIWFCRGALQKPSQRRRVKSARRRRLQKADVSARRPPAALQRHSSSDRFCSDGVNIRGFISEPSKCERHEA